MKIYNWLCIGITSFTMAVYASEKAPKRPYMQTSRAKHLAAQVPLCNVHRTAQAPTYRNHNLPPRTKRKATPPALEIGPQAGDFLLYPAPSSVTLSHAEKLQVEKALDAHLEMLTQVLIIELDAQRSPLDNSLDKEIEEMGKHYSCANGGTICASCELKKERFGSCPVPRHNTTRTSIFAR